MAKSSILLCWEYGAGLGHISCLNIVAGYLKQFDVKCILITPSGFQVPGNFDAFDEVIEFPSAHGLKPLALSENEIIVSYNATVKAFGFDNPKYLFTRLKLWQKKFEAQNPSFVIADYAPTALMTARMMGIPTMAMGNGYTLPPTNIGTYPKFVNQAETVNGNHLLEGINQALHLAKLGQISTVPEIFKSDIHACFTNPKLDPFGKMREPKAIGALLKSAPPAYSNERPERVFIYLTHCKPFIRDMVINAAIKTNLQIDIFSLQMDNSTRNNLSETKVSVIEAPLPLSKICKDYGLVIHLGGHNLMMELLEAGMPQLLLPIDIEKILHAQSMENHNFAHQLRLDKPKPIDQLTAKMQAAMSDEKMINSLKEYVSNSATKNHRAGIDMVCASIEKLLH